VANSDVGVDVLQSFGVDGGQGCKDVDVQVTDGVKQNRVVFGPVVEGGAQGRVQQGLAIGGGLPAAEGGAFADLDAGKHEVVPKGLTVGHQLLLHHHQVEIPVAVEDFLYRHLAAAVLLDKALCDFIGGLAEGVVGGDALKPCCHRVAVVGGVAGVEHHVGDMQGVGGDGAGDAGEVVDDGVGL